MVLFTKILIIAGVVGLLRSSSRFQSMSRDLDDAAISALRRIVQAAEEYGYPPDFIPLLILMTALTFMLSMYFTAAVGR